MTVDDQQIATGYASYLGLEAVLDAQQPVTAEHDEMQFIIVHQVHELWFKLLLHELAELQRRLSAGRSGPSLETAHRLQVILRVVIAQVDVMETMTPRQFLRFRDRLGPSSGSQSAQFREIETVLGRRNPNVLRHYPKASPEWLRLERAMHQPSVFDSLLQYLSVQGYSIPQAQLFRDVSEPVVESRQLQAVLMGVYADDGVAAQVCERLLDLDQAIQEWRYRHVMMAERIIGDKAGTGGTTGTAHLRKTVFRPVFPDLWRVRSQT